MKKENRQLGQALIEAILALLIAIIIVTGIVVALIFTVNTTNFTKSQNLATSLAQEGIDISRNLKEEDYIYFSTLQGYYCLDEGATTIDQARAGGDCTNNVAGAFSRQLFINQSGQDSRVNPSVSRCDQSRGKSIFVVTMVSWRDTRCTGGGGDQCHKVELNSCFADLSTLPPL